jgi:hypothetical protein
LNISGGKLITAGATVALGTQHIPAHMEPGSYIGKLQLLDSKYVVLWDDASKRGWLVNGSSALLHLIRAKLSFTLRGNFSSQLIFNPTKMVDNETGKPNSAIEVLLDQQNRLLDVYPGKNEKSEEKEVKQKSSEQPRLETSETSTIYKSKKGHFLFEDLVEQYSETLEKLFAHQRNVAGQNGVKIKTKVRKLLEGWDFVDIAEGYDAYPRVATLNALAFGWVDFVRSIGAVTLFGRGFGELIQPANCASICSEWYHLPSNRYYLAATAYDLSNITRLHGSRWVIPRETVHGLVWHCPEELNATCRCKGYRRASGLLSFWKRHVDPVQVFYPKFFHNYVRHTEADQLEETAVVVFGHNISWKYRWKDDGANQEPEEYEYSHNIPVIQAQNFEESSHSTLEPVDQFGVDTTSPSPSLSSTPPTSVSTNRQSQSSQPFLSTSPGPSDSGSALSLNTPSKPLRRVNKHLPSQP